MITVFRPTIGKEEIKAVTRVLKSGWIGLGPETNTFEKNLEKYLGHQYVVTTNSATAALHLALIAADIKKGDEVITPALSFISTSHVILYQKAIPVFCDIDEETLCADPYDIIKKITPKTKAIIVMHYGGHAVDMNPLIKICKKKHIKLIEDAAHAFGGAYKGKPLGTIGDFGCYSFHAVKNIAMGDGGALFTKNKATAKKLQSLRWMGISKDTWQRTDKQLYSWEYDVIDVGYKYHTNDILAAVGNVQLKGLPNIMKKKRKIVTAYHRGLKDISWLTPPVEKSYTDHALHNYCVKTQYRNELSTYLAKKGISTAVHYVPNNHYAMYKKFSANIPVTERVWKTMLLLPLHAQLTQKDVQYIIESVKAFKP